MKRLIKRFAVCVAGWLAALISLEAQETPDMPIWAAATWQNNIEVVKQHLAAGTDINTRDDWNGKTALHYAAEFGNTGILKLLLKSGAGVNLADYDGATPLYHAASRGFMTEVDILLYNGADPNVADTFGETPLDGAAFYGYTRVFRRLANHLAITSYDHDGRFALEVTLAAAGIYGFLNKELTLKSSKLEIQGSEDMIDWKPLTIWENTKGKFRWRDNRSRPIPLQFYRVAPHEEIPIRSPNLIDLGFSVYQARPVDGKLDGLPDEWGDDAFMINPGFMVSNSILRLRNTYQAYGIEYARFVEHDQGTWNDSADHSISFAVGWKPDGLQVIVVVEDDEHEHGSDELLAGDTVQLVFTDDGTHAFGDSPIPRKRATQHLIAALKTTLSYNSGIAYNRDKEWAEQVIAEQAFGEGEFDLAIQRKNLTSSPNTGTTIYEFRLSPQALGVKKLEAGQQFGMGICVIDGDHDTPGFQGWSGWGPDSSAFELTPAETGVLHLTE